MIVEGTGNIIAAQAEALVNTVNTVGIMGKGVALQFKTAFPENFRAYEKACREQRVVIGRMFTTRTGLLQPQFIINFPTKVHWKANSRIDSVESGLEDLTRVVEQYGIRSIAIPPLGCGLGGLRWEDVRPLIVEAFSALPEVEVIIFAPRQATAANDPRIVRTVKPEMTDWRAALISVVEAYAILGFEATHLEAQKLLYFLSRSGQAFRCNFQKGPYGPYDAGMKHGIQSMDGHYVTGFVDGGLLEPIRLLPGAAAEAKQYIEDSAQTQAIKQSVRRVAELIEGFETPYGLELLATVDWVVIKELANNQEEAIKLSLGWNDRKAKVLRPNHIGIAYEMLCKLGWLERPSSSLESASDSPSVNSA